MTDVRKIVQEFQGTLVGERTHTNIQKVRQHRYIAKIKSCAQLYLLAFLIIYWFPFGASSASYTNRYAAMVQWVTCYIRLKGLNHLLVTHIPQDWFTLKYLPAI